MPEDRWIALADATRLSFPYGRPSGRKLRLFACGCCRHVWPLLTDPRLRRVVEVSEAYADGTAGEAALAAASHAAREVGPGWSPARTRRASRRASFCLREAAADTAKSYAPRLEGVAEFAAQGFAAVRSVDATDDEPAFRDAYAAERAWQDGIILDVFGPVGRMAVDPGWASPRVLGLARRIYDERDFVRMPELGVALEEAGCRDAGVLGHCRMQGDHVRGCWVVDLLLGKS